MSKKLQTEVGMNYESWTKASLIREIETLRDGLHKLAREAVVIGIENLQLKRRVEGVDGIREVLHG
jgi:regulator of replication initiation timing